MTAEEAPRRNIWKRAGWGLFTILVAAVIIYLLIWYGPDVIARHDVGNVTGPLRVLRLQQARDAARGRLLTLGAGIFAAGALIFTGRNFTLARHQLEVSRQAIELADRAQRKTLELTEQGQVTDRYTRAIEQLGSDKLDVRIGGIYALERIARDSVRDHPTVMEVLTAFVREHSSKRRPTATDRDPNDLPPVPRRDVQTAITVIGRRDSNQDRGQINLARSNLRGADLRKAALAGATFYKADLTGAVFLDAQAAHAVFRQSELFGAILIGANLAGANLVEATLIGAHLKGADLTGADLTGANLTGADLYDADLTRAYLVSADLTGVDLDRANLREANLARAKWREEVIAPKGWMRDSTSGLLRRSNPDADEAGN